MYLQGTKSEQVTIEVSEREILNKLCEERVNIGNLYYCLKVQFFNRIGLNDNSYLKNGSWCYDDERYGGGRSLTKAEVQRTAMKDEIVAYENLLAFKESLEVLLGDKDAK